MPMPWRRCPAAYRISTTPADLFTVSWLRASFPGGSFCPATCADAAAEWYAAGAPRTAGVPVGARAWRQRLRLLWLAGLVERRGWYRVVGSRVRSDVEG